MPAYQPGGSVQPGTTGRACRESSDRLRRSLCTRLRIGRTGERPGTAPGRAQRRGRRAGAGGGAADELSAGDAPAQPLTAQYRLRAELGPRAGPPPCTLPGLIAHARIRVNGHVLFDTLDQRAQPLPRSAERIQLLRLPDEFVHDGVNEITIEAAATRYLSPSPVWIGGVAELERLYDERLLGAVIGPAIVATVMGCLALCVLLLWRAGRRSRHSGYFGAGALCWALYSAWTVLPAPCCTACIWRLDIDVLAFVVLLVIFCVRFAGWHWPRFDRTLGSRAGGARRVLYAARGARPPGRGGRGLAPGLHRYRADRRRRRGCTPRRRRDVASVLLLASGAVSLVFGLRDWEIAHRGADNNPVYLTPHAGLLFIALVAWMLIDGLCTPRRRWSGSTPAWRIASHARVRRCASRWRTCARARCRPGGPTAPSRASWPPPATTCASRCTPSGSTSVAILPAAVPEAIRDTLARMGTRCARWGDVHALLDVSRMDAGAVVPRPSPDLDALMHRLGDEFKPLAEGKGLRLLLTTTRAAGRRALADPLPGRAHQVQPARQRREVHNTAGGVLLAGGCAQAARRAGASRCATPASVSSPRCSRASSTSSQGSPRARVAATGSAPARDRAPPDAPDGAGARHALRARAGYALPARPAATEAPAAPVKTLPETALARAPGSACSRTMPPCWRDAPPVEHQAAVEGPTRRRRWTTGTAAAARARAPSSPTCNSARRTGWTPCAA